MYQTQPPFLTVERTERRGVVIIREDHETICLSECAIVLDELVGAGVNDELQFAGVEGADPFKIDHYNRVINPVIMRNTRNSFAAQCK